VLSTSLLQHGYDTLTIDSGWFGEDNLYGAQTIDEFGRLVPNTTQYPSAGRIAAGSSGNEGVHYFDRNASRRRSNLSE
jgi:hypothetical protein